MGNIKQLDQYWNSIQARMYIDKERTGSNDNVLLSTARRVSYIWAEAIPATGFQCLF